MRFEAVNKNIENPFASVGIGFDTRRVEDFRGEVTAEKPPSWSIGGRADIVLITGNYFADSKGRRTVGESSSVLDKSLMGEGVTGDEDGRARADAEGDDRAVFGTYVLKNRLELGERFEEQKKAANDGNGRRTWRNSPRGFSGGFEKGEEGVEE